MVSRSVALEQAEKEYNRVFPLIKNTHPSHSKLDYLVEFVNSETLPKILILIYFFFLIKIIVFHPLKLIIFFCVTLKKKRKYRKQFREENVKEFSSYEIFDANDTYEPNQNTSEQSEETSSGPKSSFDEAKDFQGVVNTLEINSNETNSLESSFKSNPSGSFQLSNETSVSNEEVFNKELNDLAELYADFCSYLETNHKNTYIPPSRHFLRWLHIKQKADRQLDMIRRKKYSIYDY